VLDEEVYYPHAKGKATVEEDNFTELCSVKRRFNESKTIS